MSKILEKAKARAQARKPRDTRPLEEQAQDRVSARRAREKAGEPDPRPIYVARTFAQIEPSSSLGSIVDELIWTEQTIPELLLGVVYFEGWTEEYVIFVDYSREGGGKSLASLEKVSDEFLVESIQEIGQYVVSKKLSDSDGDLLIKHLNAEILRRLDSAPGSE